MRERIAEAGTLVVDRDGGRWFTSHGELVQYLLSLSDGRLAEDRVHCGGGRYIPAEQWLSMWAFPNRALPLELRKN